MATTTQFVMTMDGNNTSYPQDGETTAVDTNAGQNIGRYINSGFEDGEKLKFPINVDSFNTPYVKFYFLDAYANFILGSP